MYVKSLIFAILLFILPIIVKAQTYVYSYADPCTGIVKTIDVPINGITVTYFGKMNTFGPNDFTNGAFENWANGVYNSFGENNPCGSTIGVSTSVSMAKNSAMNVLGIMNSLSAVSEIASSMGGGLNTNGVTESSKTDSKSSDKENNKKYNSDGSTTSSGGSKTGSTTNEGSTGGLTTTGGSTTGSTTNEGSTGGSTTSSGGSTTGESGNGLTSNNNSTGSDAATNEEKKSSNILGGSVGSIQNSTSSSTTSSKSGSSSPTKGNAPTIVLSSDFAGFNFKSGDATYGGKGTAGWTSINWDGTKSHGFMLDYTSANKGPNFTAFYALIKKRRIDLISVTGTTSFYGKGSLYGTIALGQMWNIPKVKNLKAIYMITSSYGNVYGTKFIGTAFIGGGMYDFKVGKRTQIKLTNLFIYAPYISYYNDMVLKSPYVIMPIIGTNIGVTKKFKLNVNFGGTYALGENVLNFTVMMGTRFAL